MLIHVFIYVNLRPSTSLEEETGDPDYTKAEELGRKGERNCNDIYPECSSDLLDMISNIKEEAEAVESFF